MLVKRPKIGISFLFSYHHRHVHMGGFPTLLVWEIPVKITDFHPKFVEVSYGFMVWYL